MAKKKVFDARFSILVGLQLLIAIGLGLIFFNNSSSSSSKRASLYRELGSRMQAAGVLKEATANYERYLHETTSNTHSFNSDQSLVAFSLGRLYESLFQPEKALSLYYMVELLDPDSKQKDSASKRIVALLEQLGKISASKRALKEVTSLDNKNTSIKGSPVIAKIGDKPIYLHELDQMVDQLPPEMKDKFKSKQERVRLLQKMVADEILAQKAVRLGYDKEPQIKQKLQQIQKQLLVQRVLEEELQKKISVDPADLKNYFDANLNKYIQKTRARVSLIQVKSKIDIQGIQKKIKGAKSFASLAKEHSIHKLTRDQNGKFNGYVTQGESFLGFKPEITKTVLETSINKWTQPILAGGRYTVFFVHSKEKEQRPKFEDIQNRVRKDYRMMKSQKRYQELIEESISGENVQIFSEKIK